METGHLPLEMKLEKNSPSEIDISMEDIVAIIPARGGSCGIPRKNIKFLAGKPLIAYSIEAAKQSTSISKVIVSTEDSEIAEVAEQWGAQVISRPDKLARHDTPTEPVLEHAVDFLEKEQKRPLSLVVLLQPTSPFREPKDIENALQIIRKQNGDSLLSVCDNHNFLWRLGKDGSGISINFDHNRRPRRQEMQQYQENGSIYVTKRQILLDRHNRLGGKIVIYSMPPEKSLEIDTPWDWWLAEQIIKFGKIEIYANS